MAGPGGLPQVLYVLAGAGNLFLASLVVLRARRARGALPLAFLCLSLFVWAMGEAIGDIPWRYVRLVGSSLAPAFLWHFVLVFVRRERELRRWLGALYVLAGAYALLTAGALVSERLRAAVDHAAWNVGYLAALFPFLPAALVLVRRRAAEAETPAERNAARFVAAGIAVGAATGLSNLTPALGSPLPPLGHVGSVLCALILAVAILRHRLLEREAPLRRLLFLLLLAGSLALAGGILTRALPPRAREAVVFGAAGLVAGLGLYRLFFARLQERLERARRLTLLGTMAAGVAHEIKNPLAAIKGAAQFVQKELEDVPGKESSREYLALVVAESDRLNAVVESYLAYARPLQPRLAPVDLPALLSDLVRLESASLPASVRIETAIDPEVPPLAADADLLRHAFSNVLRNAVQAMPEGGTVALRTRRVATALREYAAVEVADTGPGIPSDDLERVFQPFFTTRPRGTGLGLAIARRIAEAHEGELTAANLAPRGCSFTFLLPCRAL